MRQLDIAGIGAAQGEDRNRAEQRGAQLEAAKLAWRLMILRRVGMRRKR